MEFEEYVAARGPALLRLAYVLTSHPHLAQELVQSGLARAYGHWRRVAAAEHPDAYVRRIMVNEHLGWQRRRLFGERPHPAGDVATERTHPGSSAADPADGVVDRDEADQALRSLAPRARTVLVLRYYANLDDAAIADLLGVSASTVRSTASRALATLRTAREPHPRPSIGGR